MAALSVGFIGLLVLSIILWAMRLKEHRRATWWKDEATEGRRVVAHFSKRDAAFRQYAAYCRCCAASKESNPDNFEAWCVRMGLNDEGHPYPYESATPNEDGNGVLDSPDYARRG